MAQTQLWVERTGTRRYVGKNSRGAEVSIGPADNDASFTPGELLKIALAGCTGMSSDASFAHRLGDDYQATIHVSGDADRENENFPQLDESFEIDLSTLDDEQKRRLLTVVQRAIDASCTVGRTLEAGTTVNLRLP